MEVQKEYNMKFFKMLSKNVIVRPLIKDTWTQNPG